MKVGNGNADFIRKFCEQYHETGLFFKNLQLSAQYFDLGDLWLDGEFCQGSTSFMLNIESNFADFEV